MIQKLKLILASTFNRLVLLILILFTAFMLFIHQETNRVNEVTDAYFEIITRNAWYVGCVHGTQGNFDLCKELGDNMDFNKLYIKIKDIK